MIVVTDIAYVRYRAPDLDRMEQFLLDFGMQRAHRTATSLYMRGAGSEPYLHITELGAVPKGEASGVGFGLLAQSAADLEHIAEQFGTRVRDNSEPRGGRVVTVHDPDGMQIDVLYGAVSVPALPARSCLQFNTIGEHRRLGDTQRLAVSPSTVMRLGHAVLKVRDHAKSLAFYTSHFGFKVSDSYFESTPANPMLSFLHCGLGKRYTDHHTIAIGVIPGVGFEHTAFEVIDWDDVAVGHQYLKSKPYTHSWGIGRHIEGSQIFDYWRDPFGNKLEHWTDGDQVNDDYVPGQAKLDTSSMSQWAAPMTPDFLSSGEDQ